MTKRGGGWTLKCSTTAKDGSRVRLLKNGKATSFSRVKSGAFYLRGTGPTRGSVSTSLPASATSASPCEHGKTAMTGR